VSTVSAEAADRYRATSRNPGLLVFLIDQSGSMSEPFGPNADQGMTKAMATAEAVNWSIWKLIYRSITSQGVKNHFDVSIITYGHEEGKVDKLPNWPEKVLKLSQVEGQFVDKKVYPKGTAVFGELQVAVGDTPMEPAFLEAERLLKDWLPKHNESVPPMVINITDGEWNQGENPQAVADRIKTMSTSLGNVVVFNCHITKERVPPIIFPADDTLAGLAGNPLEVAKRLFAMSSTIPDYMIPVVKARVTAGIAPGAKGFIYNGDANALDYFAKLIIAGSVVGK
jgi:hypothetical protein